MLKKRKLSIQFMLLIWVVVPGVLSFSHIFLLLLWDCVPFPDQMGYIVPTAFSRDAFHLANVVFASLPCRYVREREM